MYYAYILKSEHHSEVYIGFTLNPLQRLKQHNNGDSPSTKRYAPWKVVYLGGYADKENAIDRERKLKQFGKAYSQLKRRIHNSLMS